MGRTHNVPHGNQVVDEFGFGPPMLGGCCNCRFAFVEYTDTTPKELFALPRGAEICCWKVVVVTGFNSSGTDLLDIGDGSTGNRFANDLDIDTAGEIVTGFDVDEYASPLADETVITATFVQSVADASAGKALVMCEFILR